MSAASKPGEIITFYSYKGGTGRSMGLANVACVLAEAPGAGAVLMLDWDLEAPGLHRFFPGRLRATSVDGDLGLDHRLGLIDLFHEIDQLTPSAPPESEDEADERATEALGKVDVERFIGDSGVPGVRLMRAGRDDDGRYGQRVNTMDWESLFHRSPHLFRCLAQRLAASYAHVLIDSRTGIGDISGICTSLMPERLVVVFTPNRQSLTGLKKLVESATKYRMQSDDLRRLIVYPLPSRIEATREDLRQLWRFGSRDHGIVGYQPMFEALFACTYGLSNCRLGEYFDQVQIQQTPDYAYGESIAVVVERSTDRFSLSRSYRVLTEWLVQSQAPWQSLAAAQGAAQSSTAGDTVSGTPPPPPPPPPASVPVPKPSPAPGGVPEPAAQQEQQDTGISAGSRAEAPGQSAAPPSSTTAQRYDVFLSYAESDRAHAEALAAQLAKRGVSVWWDRGATPPGRSIEDVVADVIDRSRWVVALWSKASLASSWVQTEATEGVRRNDLLSVLLEDVRLPLEYRTGHLIDLRGWSTTRSASDLAPLLDSVRLPVAAAPPRAKHVGRLVTAIAGSVLVIVAAVLFVPRLGNRVGLLPGRPPGATVEVPTLVGQPLDRSVALLSGVQLSIGNTVFRQVTDVAPGTVLQQSVQPGGRARRNSKIDLVVAAPGDSTSQKRASRK